MTADDPTRLVRGAPDGMILIILAVATIVIRYPLFGDPLFHVDEQFYLLVGDRMLHGALPYVDIWDRKPIGLFLLFAGFRLLPGDGILAYQIASTASVILTAIVIARIGRRFAGAWAVTSGSIIYVLACEFLGGGGGQSPVFYNLPVALAALFVLRACAASGERHLIRDGSIAMLLMGAAIQIKYTAVVEGVYFGCVLLWAGRRLELSLGRIMREALLFAALGIAPTALAGGYYALIGHFGAFWYANFASIAIRGPLPPGMAANYLRYDAIVLAPFIPMLAAAMVRILRARSIDVRIDGAIMLGWFAAATLGFLSIGGYFFHYALPMLSPLAVMTVIACSRSVVGPAYVGAWLTVYLVHFEPLAIVQRNFDEALATRMTRIAAPYAGSCMQVFTNQVSIQFLTHACLATSYPFPQHLITARERDALGVDQVGALRALLARRPGVMIVAPRAGPGVLHENMAILDADLAAHYRAIFRVPDGPGIPAQPAFIFVRRDLLSRTSTGISCAPCRSIGSQHHAAAASTRSEYRSSDSSGGLASHSPVPIATA